MDGSTDNVKTVYPPQTKFAGGGGVIIKCFDLVYRRLHNVKKPRMVPEIIV